MKKIDDPKYVQHSCPEDLGHMVVLYDPARDSWTIYNTQTERLLVVDIVWCPFCGKILNQHDETGIYSSGTSEPLP